MPPEVLKYLHDVDQACVLILQFTENKTIDEYRADAQLQSAVERQFITIGEALQQALRAMPALDQSLTDSRRIVNFRNVMVHGYAKIANDTVWGVVESSLPVLQSEVRKLISS